MRKRVCVLQVTPEHPNPEHIKYFKDRDGCDFYFVTHDAPNPDALKFCPDTTWTDTRNTLVEMVPRNYDYYAFIDHDYILRPQGELGVLEQMLHDLQRFEPAVLTFYPGKGIHTPYSGNEEYRKSRQYSIIPFTHAAYKVVHHSLLDWFFPMVTKFGGGFNSCHLFNILEIPFLKNVVCSHGIIYDNGQSNSSTPHNRDGAKSHQGMQDMWMWILPAFKHIKIVDLYFGTPDAKYDSLSIKNAFMGIFKDKDLSPVPSSPTIDYLEHEKLKNFFDLDHGYFKEKKWEIAD